MWLLVTLALLAVGAYLFGRLSHFDDTAELAAQVAELRTFEERMATAGVREQFGLMPEGTSRLIIAEAEAYAAALSLHGERHTEVTHHINAYIDDLHGLADLTDRFTAGETTITDVAISYPKLSGEANAHIDEALQFLSTDGQELAAELRRAGFFGLGLLVVGGVSSAAAYGWTSRRARALTLDIERTRELDQLKSEFVAMASHELRTPLTGIYGFSELLGEDGVSAEERRRWASHIRSEAERLTTIVEDLLNVSRIDAGNLELKSERVEFAEIVATVLRSFEGQADTHTFEAGGDISALVRGDRDKLVEVLGNLVDNAVKYSPAGGRVRIECVSGAELLRVRVSDEGLGIPEGELDAIFERFTRVSSPDTESIRSTGLGLYVVRELVTRMGGVISVESVLGQGSTFTFSVPLCHESQELEAAA
jgi:signal transduction histidine kinase